MSVGRTIAKQVTIANRRIGLLIAVLVLSVILAGTVYSLFLGNELRYLPDEQDYFSLAENLVERGIYSLDGENPSAYRPPGYPFFLAVFRLLGAEAVHFRILNYLLLGLSMALTGKLLKEHSSPLAAGLGVLGVIAYPVLFYTAGTLYPQILASFLFLLVILLFTRSKNPPGRATQSEIPQSEIPQSEIPQSEIPQNRIHQNEIRMRDYVLGGLCLGCLILTVPTFAFTLPVFAAWLWWNPGRGRLVGALVAVATASLLVSLWIARNYAVFDSFVFVSSNSGENLLLGFSEDTTANAGTNVDISKYVAQASHMGEVERDRFYRAQAIQYILDHPSRSAQLYLLKFLNYFNFRNELVTRSEGSTARDILMLLTYGPLVLVSLLRVSLMRRFPPSAFEVLSIVLYLSSALFSALFFTRIRFRLPFDFLLILLSAVFLDRVIRTLFLEKGERTSKIFIHTGEKNEQNV